MIDEILGFAKDAAGAVAKGAQDAAGVAIKGVQDVAGTAAKIAQDTSAEIGKTISESISAANANDEEKKPEQIEAAEATGARNCLQSFVGNLSAKQKGAAIAVAAVLLCTLLGGASTAMSSRDSVNEGIRLPATGMAQDAEPSALAFIVECDEEGYKGLTFDVKVSTVANASEPNTRQYTAYPGRAYGLDGLAAGEYVFTIDADAPRMDGVFCVPVSVTYAYDGATRHDVILKTAIDVQAVEAHREEQERLAAEEAAQAEQERIAAEQAERDRIASEQAERERIAAEQAAAAEAEEQRQREAEAAAAAAEKKSRTVYITNSGKKYHSDGCRHLAKSKIAISYDDARATGYEPCGTCRPG